MTNDHYEFRDASLLDIPFIFNLIYEGSLEGVFSDNLHAKAGPYTILKMLLPSLKLFSQFQPKSAPRKELLMVHHQGEELGFIQLEITALDEKHKNKYIATCSIAHAFRGQGHGTNMIAAFVNDQEPGTRIIAISNKYAKPMRAILKTLHFQRKSIGSGLDSYEKIIEKVL